jgi:hypothetical protein
MVGAVAVDLDDLRVRVARGGAAVVDAEVEGRAAHQHHVGLAQGGAAAAREEAGVSGGSEPRAMPLTKVGIGKRVEQVARAPSSRLQRSCPPMMATGRSAAARRSATRGDSTGIGRGLGLGAGGLRVGERVVDVGEVHEHVEGHLEVDRPGHARRRHAEGRLRRTPRGGRSEHRYDALVMALA